MKPVPRSNPFSSQLQIEIKTHFFPVPAGEQYTYRCLSCPFSSMTISQLKEHSLTDHGEALTLTKLRAATQAAHAAPRPPRLATNTEQTTLAPDGNYVILLNHMTSPRFGGWKKRQRNPKQEALCSSLLNCFLVSRRCVFNYTKQMILCSFDKQELSETKVGKFMQWPRQKSKVNKNFESEKVCMMEGLLL